MADNFRVVFEMNFLCSLFNSPLYDMLRKNLVSLATATTGMSHPISSVFIPALGSRGQMMGKQGGSECCH